MVFPMLACFFVSILFFFRVMQAELQIEKAMADAGQTLAVYGSGKSESNGGAVSLGLLKLSVMEKLKNSGEVAGHIAGGAAGIRLSGTECKGDFIDIRAVFQMKLPVSLPGRKSVKIARHVVCRKWTGWKGETYEEEGEIWVYVAKTGNVYHRVRECTHLKLTVRSVNMSEVGSQRNENGERYKACEQCAKKKKAKAAVYITDTGNRYHYDLACGGIKRSVFMIKLSDVGTRRPCSRCGNENGERKRS